jgi:hypothetical protein
VHLNSFSNSGSQLQSLFNLGAMALLTFKSPVEYDQQQSQHTPYLAIHLLTYYFTAAFEGFLESFKTMKTVSVADGLLDMNIDEDDISDEYDFAESDEEAQESRRAARKQASMPISKYMDILQQVANRQVDEITIDLDDLSEVCVTVIAKMTSLIYCFLVRENTGAGRHKCWIDTWNRD